MLQGTDAWGCLSSGRLPGTQFWRRPALNRLQKTIVLYLTLVLQPCLLAVLLLLIPWGFLQR